uniref:Uncharacterized protein n=1 Tax=Tanacetum cinerariifolium TaxID=118510 RepID=A0A699HTW1_TANCI|nr:hypothetical protein [Tanacetum cinerariifolium]
MSGKENDPEAIKQNISHKPIDYEKLNRLTEDFEKRFAPQQKLSTEQAFWLRMSNPSSKPYDALPVKVESPKELPKISLVNENLKKLKFHLAKFDNVIGDTVNKDENGKESFNLEAELLNSLMYYHGSKDNDYDSRDKGMFGWEAKVEMDKLGQIIGS